MNHQSSQRSQTSFPYGARLKILGPLLHDRRLWALTRRSVPGAVAVGLFTMYLPPFGQYLIAAVAAALLRVNLPIAVSLVWITNPLTIPPLFYFSYCLGCALLGQPSHALEASFWFDWHSWLSVLYPLALGNLVCGTVLAVLGYAAAVCYWRWHLVYRLKQRKRRHALAFTRR